MKITCILLIIFKFSMHNTFSLVENVDHHVLICTELNKSTSINNLIGGFVTKKII